MTSIECRLLQGMNEPMELLTLFKLMNILFDDEDLMIESMNN
jgi:hypothetical protein